MNKSYMMIMSGLLMMMVIAVFIYFDLRSPVIYILLAVGFVLVGLGILLGFVKMVTEESQ